VLSLDGVLSGGTSHEAAIDDIVRRAYSRSLPRQTVALLSDVLEDPRAAAFSVLARTPSVDYLRALLDSSIASYSSLDDLLPASLSRLMESGHLNTLSAIADLQRGDVEAARSRLGEGAAVALRLWEIPLLASYAYPLLRGEALAPLASLADAEGVAYDARALRSAREALPAGRPVGPGLGSAGLGAEMPDMTRLGDVVVRGPMPPGERFGILMSAWAGICGNPREIISGPSRIRDSRMLSLADSTGVAHGRELVLLARRRWSESINSQGGSAGVFSGVADHGPAAVARRILRCATEIQAAH
jgi:hypothetical protein